LKLVNRVAGPRRSAMDDATYWRDQAATFRLDAERAPDRAYAEELLELAAICERVACEIEDHAPSG
jgi:hypothetical protein